MKNLRAPHHKLSWLAGIACVLAALVWTTSALSAGAVPTWSQETQVTATGATTTQAPQFLSGSDGSITAITVETVNSVYSVLARKSSDGGATWGSPQTLSATAIASTDASVVTLNNGVFAVAWAEASGTSGVNQIRLRTSSDNGATWSSAVTISTAGGSALAANSPHLAALGAGDLVVGYQQSNGSNDIARVRSSASNLQSWTQSVPLSAAGSNAKFVTPAVNSQGDIIVSWVLEDSNTENQAQVAGSAGNWGTVTTLSSYPNAGVAHIPFVVALPTGAFVVLWPDPDSSSSPGFNIKARITSNAGSSWDNPVEISGRAFATSVSAVVTADGGIAAAWSMGTGGYTYIQSSYSSPSSTPAPAPSSSSSSSPSSSSSSSPSSSSSSSSSSSPLPTSTGAGSAWSAPVSVSPAVTGQYYTGSKLSISPDGTVGMVVRQNVGSTYSSGYAFSSDNGQTWPDGVGSITSWLSSPLSIGDVSIQALAGQGFAFGWQTLTNSNPNAGFARVYGWVAGQTSTSTPAPRLPATGFSVWAPGLLAVAFFGSGVLFWAVTARSRRRR